jgi:hypothetical protein
VKFSELQRALTEEFGPAYSGVLLRDHWLTRLGSTGGEALESGIDPKRVWLAICEEFEIPAQARYGRGLREPHQDQ